MGAERPVSLYMVVPPSDISRTRPLVRLILNQIARRLTEMLPADSAASRRRLLLMLDEFPALGRLDFFESSLAFLAGYGVRAFLVAQSLHQIDKAYGHNHAILDNCHVRVAFAPNDERTAKRLSDALGTATELRAQKNLSGRRFSAWLSHVSMSEQETPRPLLTAGEIFQLPAHDALVLASGSPPIRARKLKYFADCNFLDRRLAPPALAVGGFKDVPPPRPNDWFGAGRCVHPKLDKAWSEVLRSDDDPPRTRELTRVSTQPDRHRDLPLFAERTQEPEVVLEADGPPLPDDDPVVQFPGGVRV
jgi:type IV secretion system protein VirD4